MKKTLTFLMLMLCCIGFVFANPVDSKVAKKVALNFLKTTEKAAADLQEEYLVDITATTPFHEFYIFSIRNRSGFLVVSGDDGAMPILGYSLSNTFVSEGMPAQVREWLESYEAQIVSIREQGLAPSEQVARQWQQYGSEECLP